MKKNRNRFNRNKNGVALVFMVMLLVSLLGLGGFVSDLAIAYTMQARIKNALDLSALAGISQMENTSYISTAKTTALNYFNTNLLSTIPGFTPIAISDPNLTIQGGVYDLSTGTFTLDEVSSDVNALSLSYMTQCMTYFSSIFMIDNINISATATVAKQPAGYIAPGSGFPLVAYESALTSALSNSNMVNLYANGGFTDNSYWTDYTDSNPSTSDVRALLDYLQYMIGSAPPGVTVNDDFAINDGGMISVYMDLDPTVLIGMTFIFPVIEDGAMITATAKGFIGARIDAIVDTGSDRYLSITIQPGHIDNTFGGAKVVMSTTVNPSNQSLLVDSFTLVE